MPRNPQGLYTPPLPPVRAGELIESVWANTTVDDIASALTGSLPRNGTAPMLAPLTLSNIPPTQPRHAVDKGYLESFLAYATGMPIGSLLPVAGSTIPSGFLLCDGQAVSRTTYPDLFASIGTIYGSGDGSTTFNVPDLRDWFVRGKADSRLVGSTQSASLASHTHPVNDPTHIHAASGSQVAHAHATVAHTHGVNDPGHVHPSVAMNGFYNVNANPGVSITPSGVTGSAQTGISLQSAAPNTDSQQPGMTVSVSAAPTGLVVGATGDAETRPQNIAMNYVIKAIDDSAQTVGITGITSSDDNAISIDGTNPVVPELDIHTNVAFGLVKLDASGKVPLNQMPTGSQQLLGYWNASSGQLPTGTFSSGATYIISVAGVLTVYDPVTLTSSPTAVNVGYFIQYITGSMTNPTGWYHVVPSTTVTAGQVQFTPVGSISSANVQGAIAELDGDVVANTAAIGALVTADANNVKQTAPTGAAVLPAGTDAERPVGALGLFRYNLTDNVFEGYTPNGWGQVGGGQMYGAAPVKAIFYNYQNIPENIDVLINENGGSFGPVTVDNGFTVTVANGSVYTVV